MPPMPDAGCTVVYTPELVYPASLMMMILFIAPIKTVEKL
jgi:hypothetical protein